MTSDPTHIPLLERPLVRGALAAILLVAVVGGFLGFSALTGDDDSDTTIEVVPTRTTEKSQEAGLGPVSGSGASIGGPAPDFILRNLMDETVQLSQLEGQVVWINFWATWCGPCKTELPIMQDLYDEKHAQGLEILAINLEESADAARSFFDDRGLAMPVLLDESGSVYEQYRLQGLPDSFFIDRAGNIAAVQYGEITEAKARERLAAAGLP